MQKRLKLHHIHTHSADALLHRRELHWLESCFLNEPDDKTLWSVKQVVNIIVIHFLSDLQSAGGTELWYSQIQKMFSIGFFCCWGSVKRCRAAPILSHFSSFNRIIPPCNGFFATLSLCHSEFICMHFLQARSNQWLCIICLEETGTAPSARSSHRAYMATLAPPPLLWLESQSVELKAPSLPCASPIIDQMWQRTAINIIYLWVLIWVSTLLQILPLCSFKILNTMNWHNKGRERRQNNLWLHAVISLFPVQFIFSGWLNHHLCYVNCF